MTTASTATAPAPPHTPYAPPATPTRPLPSRTATYISLGLFVLTFLTWSNGAPGLPAPIILGWLATNALVLLDTLDPRWYLPLGQRYAWLRRPRLGLLASLVYVVVAVLLASPSFPAIMWLAATVVFVRDAAKRGELDGAPFDPRLLWRGWRLALLAGVVLANLTLLAPWENWAVYAPGYSTEQRVSRTTVERTWHPSYHAEGTGDAYDQGLATVPILLIAGALAWSAWRGKRGAGSQESAFPTWYRYVPAGIAGGFVLWGVTHLAPRASEFGSAGGPVIAAGPSYMLLCLAPFYLGAAVFALKGIGQARPAPIDVRPQPHAT